LDRATEQFAQASTNRRASDKRWDGMSQQSACGASESDAAHQADLRQRDSEDTQRGQDDKAWSDAYAKSVF